MNKKLINYTGVNHPNYWKFAELGARVVASAVAFPFFVIGVLVAVIRKKIAKKL